MFRSYITSVEQQTIKVESWHLYLKSSYLELHGHFSKSVWWNDSVDVWTPWLNFKTVSLGWSRAYIDIPVRIELKKDFGKEANRPQSFQTFILYILSQQIFGYTTVMYNVTYCVKTQCTLCLIIHTSLCAFITPNSEMQDNFWALRTIVPLNARWKLD